MADYPQQAAGEAMMLTPLDRENRKTAQQLEDIANYGHVVDRKRAIKELHPPLRVVLQDVADPVVDAQVAAYAARKRARRTNPGPHSLGRAA